MGRGDDARCPVELGHLVSGGDLMVVRMADAPDSLRECVAGELLAYRKTHGLSQERFARMLQVSVRSYADLEYGVFMPSTVTMLRFLLMLDDQELLCFLSTIEEFLGK